MFKKGDKVRRLQDGRILTVRMHRTGVLFIGNNTDDDQEGEYANGFTNDKQNIDYVLIKLGPCNNDIEWLDRVQQNFKE